VTIGVTNEIGDSSVDCQSYIAFVIEVVGTLGLSIGPNITWNEITPDEPITTGIVQTGRRSHPCMSGERGRSVTDFNLNRIGKIKELQPGNPNEVESALNPAVLQAKDGQLYRFPRLVARGNYSRIGITRVLFDASGDPMGVECMGIAFEPEADYELSEHGGEDPHISYVESLQLRYDLYRALAPRPANRHRLLG
jgi:hypothetical protein